MSHDLVEVRPTPRPSWRLRGLAVGVVLVVLAALAGLVSWVATQGQPSTSPEGGTLACPTGPGAPGSVPAAPTAPRASGHLVPDRAPTSVVVCEYGDVVVARPAGPAPSAGGVPGISAGPVATPTLRRSAVFDGADPRPADLVAALRGVSAQTSFPAAGCAVSDSDVSPRPLVGLTYADGAVWIALTGCDVVTNGDTAGVVDLLDLVGRVLDGTDGTVGTDGTGSTGDPGVSVAPVPSDPPTVTGPSPTTSGGPADSGSPTNVGTPVDDPFAACTASTAGRADTFVPFTPTAVRVCHLAVDPSAAAPTVVDRGADVAVPLADALDARPTLEPDVACTDIGGEVWALLYTAAEGTTVAVRVDAGGCGTASNGARTAEVDAALFDALSAAD